MKLIVGLGNPGKEYVQVRHNLGFMVVDEYVASSKYHVPWEESKKFKSLIAKTNGLIFVKPQTFMNNSGLAIKSLTAYYQLPATDLIVIHDELDLPLGRIQVKKGGSAAGHHGVESIIETFGTDQFIRIRVGIGPAVGAPDRFVLKPFAKAEKPQVEKVIEQAVKAINLLLEQGLEVAQNQFN